MHTLEKPPEIFRIDSRRYSVTQIEDMSFGLPLNLERPGRALDFTFNRISSTVQNVGVNVALECDLAVGQLSRHDRIHEPVEAEDVPAATRR